MTAILSHVFSTSQYLPLEVFPEQFLVWHQGSKEATRPRRAGVLKGLGLSSLCVYRSWTTHGPQPEGKQSSVQLGKLHSETILSSGLSAYSFLLIFSPLCNGEKNPYRCCKMLWVVSNSRSEWLHWLMRRLQRSNTWKAPHH